MPLRASQNMRVKATSELKNLDEICRTPSFDNQKSKQLKSINIHEVMDAWFENEVNTKGDFPDQQGLPLIKTNNPFQTAYNQGEWKY